MVKKLAAALAMVLVSFATAPGLVAPSQAADDYTAATRTSCHVAVPAVVRVNHAPRITITVRPNGPAPAAPKAAQPTGTVELSISRNGAGIFSRTVSYHGRAVTVQGPVITQAGHYVVHAQFRAADGSTFRSCHSSTGFDVRKGQGPTHDNPPPPNGGDNPTGGLLPDTGGPDSGWLLLGLALTVTGLGLVVASRARRETPYLA